MLLPAFYLLLGEIKIVGIIGISQFIPTILPTSSQHSAYLPQDGYERNSLIIHRVINKWMSPFWSLQGLLSQEYYFVNKKPPFLSLALMPEGNLLPWFNADRYLTDWLRGKFTPNKNGLFLYWIPDLWKCALVKCTLTGWSRPGNGNRFRWKQIRVCMDHRTNHHSVDLPGVIPWTGQ